MKKSLLGWKTKGLFYRKSRKAGFTLVEILIVVILIGIIAAIGAPGWLTFTNQRRVTAANDVVLRALQEAQSNAKKEKLSYSVSFRTQSGQVPEIAIYRTVQGDGSLNKTASVVDPTSSNNLWRSLGQDLSLKPGQVILGTNLNGENNNNGTSINYSPDGTAKITFDYMGVLDQTRSNPDIDPPLTIVVAAAAGGRANSTNPVPATRRCVKITTLLGSIQPGRGNECNL